MEERVVKKKKKLKLKKNVVYMTALFFATLFMCVGYASLNSIILDISSVLGFKSNREILITDAKYLSNTNANIQNSKINDYYKTTLDSTISLTNNANSTITYEVVIKNNTDDKYMFDGVKYINSLDFYDNENIDFTIDGIKEKDILYSNESVRIKITFKYKDPSNITNNTLSSKLNFKFRKIYDIEYQNMIIKDTYPKYAYADEVFNLGFDDNFDMIDIEMNNKTLESNEYEFSNNTLNIEEVNGDLIIKKVNDIFLSSYIKKLFKEAPKEIVLTGNRENIVQAASTSLQVDSYDNLRYYGNTPNNYILINNELWRIIGVFDDVKNDKDEVQTRVKIIKDDSIGTFSYSYDGDDRFGGGNYYLESDIKNVLDLYYNRQSGICLLVYEQIPCDFTLVGLSDEAKSFISPARFYLGSFNTYESVYYANQIYNFERNNQNYICKENERNCPRLSSFVSPIALMYPSDYLYAVDFKECKEHDMYGEHCTSNNYLTTENIDVEYLLNGSSETDIYNYGIYHNWSGMFGNFITSQDAEIRPSVYLKSEVTYVMGDGSRNNPYKIDNASKHSVTYENIKVRKSYPKEAYDKENLIINFYDEIPTGLQVYQDGVLLSSGYTFSGNTLVIDSVRGDIRIEVTKSNKIMVSNSTELMDAISNYANSSEFVEIVLMDDITTTTPIVISQGKNLTLDLNNYRIVNNDTDLIQITGGENIKIKNSGEKSYSKRLGVVVQDSFSGVLIIDGLNIESIDDACVRNQSTQNGKLIIKNCNLYSQNWAGINSNRNNIIDVYDSTVRGKNYSINNNGGGEINIYSGNFDGPVNNQTGSRLNIYGGTFTVNVNPANGYTVTRNSDNKYVVSLIEQ